EGIGRGKVQRQPAVDHCALRAQEGPQGGHARLGQITKNPSCDDRRLAAGDTQYANSTAPRRCGNGGDGVVVVRCWHGMRLRRIGVRFNTVHYAERARSWKPLVDAPEKDIYATLSLGSIGTCQARWP